MKDKFEYLHALLEKGNFSDVLKALLNERGRINEPYDDDLNHAWYIAGDVYYQSGDLRKSLNAFKKALTNRTDDIEAMWAIAECYSDLGSPSEAESYIRKALSILPERCELIYNLGNALFDQKEYVEAIECYRKVMSTTKNGELAEQAQKNYDSAMKRIEEIEKNKRLKNGDH